MGARGGPRGHQKRSQGQAMGGLGKRGWLSPGTSGFLGGTPGTGQGLVRVGDMGPPWGGFGPGAQLVYFVDFWF